MWLFGWWRTNVSLQLQTAHLSQRRGEESRHQRVIDSSNDLLGGWTAIVSAERLLKRHHLPPLGCTGQPTLPGAGSHHPRPLGGGGRLVPGSHKYLIVQQTHRVLTLEIREVIRANGTDELMADTLESLVKELVINKRDRR